MADTTNMTLRVPDTIIDRLRAAARAHHHSVHAEILTLVERGLDEQEGKDNG
jgi:plasmid stability protein